MTFFILGHTKEKLKEIFMTHEKILNDAKEAEAEIIENRRWLHSHAEVGFELHETFDFVWSRLCEMGYDPMKCGKCGIVCDVGKDNRNAVLLRADMDALPMNEGSALPFASKNGNMHSCGHDTHTAMLLGAAEILKKYENQLNGTVRLMFQPAEETLEGAADMIRDGLLSSGDVKAAFMIHSVTGIPIPAGTLIVASGGVSSPAADYFKITVRGNSCHGSTPQLGIDAISAGAHILLAIQEISARELGVGDRAIITVGRLCGGTAGNIIADKAELEGTIRAYDENTRMFIKKRLAEISSAIASAFRAKADTCFGSGCPTLINNGELSKDIINNSKKLLGEASVKSTAELGSTSSGASEDFSYISQQIPSVMLTLAAGEPQNGYVYSQHHPNAVFDERVLSIGAAVYAYNAIKLLESKTKFPNR